MKAPIATSAPFFWSFFFTLWGLLGTTPVLNAEVLVRISKEEYVHQISKVYGKIFLATESGAYRVDGDELISLDTGTSIVRAVIGYEGAVLLGTEGGIFEVQGNETFPVYRNLTQSISVSHFEVFSGSLWVGSSQGLLRITGENVTQVLSGQAIFAIEEIEDSLWVGTSKNAYRFQAMTPEPVFSKVSKRVVGVVRAGGKIWLTTLRPEGGYGPCYWLSESGPVAFLAREKVAVIAEAWGQVWIGSTHGIARVEDLERLPITVLEGEKVNAVEVFRDEVWIGTTRRGAYRISGDNGAAWVPPVGHDLNVKSFKVIDGVLWLRAESGAYRLDEEVRLLARLNTTPDFFGFELLEGDRIARVAEVRYDLEGQDPYSESIPKDFEAIIEFDQDVFEVRVAKNDFVPVESLERNVELGPGRLFFAVRDTFGNQYGPHQSTVFVSDMKLILIAVLAIFVLCLVILVIWLLRKHKLAISPAIEESEVSPPAIEGSEVSEKERRSSGNPTASPVRDDEIVGSSGKLLSEFIGTDQRYEIVERKPLGHGGTSWVLEGIDHELGRPVAMKCLPSSENDLLKKRLLREAKVMAKLVHPSIPQIYGFIEHGNETYIVMELIKGRDLAFHIGANISFCQKYLRKIAEGVGEALAIAHRNSIVHCDVKPSNVMVRNDRSVVLVDFGVAKILSRLTDNENCVIGTPAYMAPEQGFGRVDIDAKSDIYSFGILLYEIASNGHLPFSGAQEVVLARQERLSPQPPSFHNPRVASGFDELILSCIEKSPFNRPQAMEEVLDLLRRTDIFINLPSDG